MQERAEILTVDFPDTAAARIVIQAPASKIFDLLADPKAQRWWVYKTDSLNRNPKWMAKSLVKLKTLCEG